MKTDLEATLRHLAGHLIVESPDDERRLEALYESLAGSTLPEDRRRTTGSDFSIARSDLFFAETIPGRRRDVLEKLADRIRKSDPATASRVFVREVPIQEPLLYASVPDWAAGARVSRTVGPFEHVDGRRLWFDFYRVAKLTRLFLQGTAAPVLLFPPARRQPGPGRGATYALGAGSIWIRAQVLVAAAPADGYVGLTIAGGRISMDVPPTVQDGDLMAPALARVRVELDLDMAEDAGRNENSRYGEDARRLRLELPRRLAFHFSAADRGIDEVGDAGWRLHGQALRFSWRGQRAAEWDPVLKRLLVPLSSSEPRLRFTESHSPVSTVRGEADIQRTGWALPVAAIDTSAPPEAGGTGAVLLEAGPGIHQSWTGLENGPIHLAHPLVLAAPGSILLADMASGNPHAHHDLDLWRDATNPFGSSVSLTFPPGAFFFHATTSAGVEVLMAAANAHFKIDRPVQVDGAPPDIRSRHSLLVVAASDAGRLIYLFDDNLLQDAASLGDDGAPATLALALTNALFTVSRANGCLLFGTLDEGLSAVERGILYLTFGLYAYLPTLPDPYAANLGVLRRQIRGRGGISSPAREVDARGALATPPAAPITAWLVCRVRWNPPAAGEEFDAVSVSFHFAPLANQFGGISLADDAAGSEGSAAGGSPAVSGGDGPVATPLNDAIGSALAAHNRLSSAEGRFDTLRATAAATADAPSTSAASTRKPLPDYGEIWDKTTRRLSRNLFALLDVSTNADLYGVSFDLIAGRDPIVTTHVPVAPASTFPIQVSGMDVVSAGQNVKAFTVPQISWEPLINLTPPAVSGDPSAGFNYYPDDGGPTQILNNSPESVALAPLPMTAHLLRGFEEDPAHFAAYALMTLPFGMRALAVLQDQFAVPLPNGGVDTRPGTQLRLNAETFASGLKGGLQLQVNAGEAFIDGESNMFVGSTLQLNNVLDALGNAGGDSTLGRTVTEIFNNEFLLQPFDPFRQRGVPLERIDLSGYGASTFSNWLNPTAAFAETSQARFDVFVGRCAHEVIQVKSIVYPWAIRVVRTITIFRVGSGYVYRHDSGWRAESSGQFDFRYWVNLTPANKQEQASPFRIHPGLVRGLHNVRNIVETEEVAPASGSMVSPKIVDGSGLYVDNPAPGDALPFELQPVYFDADVEIEGLVSGFQAKTIGGTARNVTPSKRILGYVQVAPRGIPIVEATLRDLVIVQLGTIGGPIDCEVDLAGSGQKMRLSRFDFNNSFGANGSDIAFAMAGRGSVLLPKDGSWTMVKHERGTGEVTPVPPNLSVPVIRTGMLVKDGAGQKLDTPPGSVLLRIANPTELLRAPVDDTLNYGFLQNTDTQKALFLTPSFQMGQARLFSKTPPLFVDAFRIVNSKSIFPNIGNAESSLGEAISLAKNGTEFLKGALKDGGADVWRLMDVTAAADNAAAQGFQLLKQVATFDLPDTEFELIDVGDGNFRIYIEYQQKDKNGNQQAKGDLDFNIDSLANDVADTWKSRMGNIGLVVDLAGIDRLMTIRGNWDSKKGAGTAYPQPELVFADELQPVIDILEILQKLQGGDYAGAVANGLKLAMSNKAGTWEYKFEASKEIPVLRFPVPDAVYNDPNTPFKLEAGLTIGAYFNAAIKVTTDANELLPSAGGLMGFYGRLSVMCVSLSAATVYAIGQVNLEIAADTKVGPSLRMKFGFGAQIVVGLPVAGNVSVLFVVGVEIFAATGTIEVTAFMLFEGHAEILGGLVAITIRIEAKGTVSKKAIGSGSRTDLVCQVTFGLDISIFLVINISFETSWSEQRRIAN